MCARDRIKSPADLKGKRVGLPEYQLTACVWARIILEDDHGVKPSDIVWVRGGIEHPGRPEKITIKLPPGVRMEDAPAGTTISELLERGDIDGFIAPRVPSLAAKNNPDIGWLFADPIAAGRDYFRRTGIFPIMHVTGVRRALVEKHPWLPAAVFKAFAQSKAKCLDALEDTAATQGHAAVRGGAAARRARLHGQRFLVLWARAEPQGAGDVPASPPCAGAVVAAGGAGGAVPSRDPRELRDLGRSRYAPGLVRRSSRLLTASPFRAAWRRS